MTTNEVEAVLGKPVKWQGKMMVYDQTLGMTVGQSKAGALVVFCGDSMLKYPGVKKFKGRTKEGIGMESSRGRGYQGIWPADDSPAVERRPRATGIQKPWPYLYPRGGKSHEHHRGLPARQVAAGRRMLWIHRNSLKQTEFSSVLMIMHTRRAFTLVELLVVIAIIAITGGAVVADVEQDQAKGAGSFVFERREANDSGHDALRRRQRIYFPRTRMGATRCRAIIGVRAMRRSAGRTI